MSTLFYINLHKALVMPLVVALMCWYHNGSPEAFLYLSMHGTYSLLWLFKEATFPDQRFAKQIPPQDRQPQNLRDRQQIPRLEEDN